MRVPELPGTRVSTVKLSSRAVLIQPDKPAQISISAFDKDGKVIDLDKHKVEVFAIGAPEIQAKVEGSKVNLFIIMPLKRDAAHTAVHIYVDKRKSEYPISVVATRIPGDFRVINGDLVCLCLPESQLGLSSDDLNTVCALLKVPLPPISRLTKRGHK